MSSEVTNSVLQENKKNIKFASYSFIGTALNYGSKFVFFVWLAKYIGFSSFGIISIVMSVVLLFEKLFNPQIWLFLIKENKGKDVSQHLIIKCIFYELLFKFFALVVYLFFILTFVNENKELYLIYGFYIFISFVGTAIGLIRINNDFKSVFLSNFIVFITVIITFSFINVFNIKSLSLILFCILLVDFFYFSYLLYKSTVFNFIFKAFNLTYFKVPELKSIVIFHLNGALRVLNRELDVILISLFFSNSTVGIYKLSKQIVHLPLFLTDGLYNSIYPSLCNFFHENKKKEFSELIRSNLIIGVKVGFFSMFVVIFISLLLQKYYYTDADGLFISSAILLFPIFIAVITFPFAPAINAVGKALVLFKINCVSVSIYFITLIMFSYLGSYYLALFSYLIYYISWSLLSWLVIKKEI